MEIKENKKRTEYTEQDIIDIVKRTIKVDIINIRKEIKNLEKR